MSSYHQILFLSTSNNSPPAQLNIFSHQNQLKYHLLTSTSKHWKHCMSHLLDFLVLFYHTNPPCRPHNHISILHVKDFDN